MSSNTDKNAPDDITKGTAHRHYQCCRCGAHLIVLLEKDAQEKFWCGHCGQMNPHSYPQVCYAPHPKNPEPKAK
jgi:transcription elongation factor Elf1